MRDAAEIASALSAANPWWREPDSWTSRDPQLLRAEASPIDYRPTALDSIRPDGLYILYGPRRVGKSVLIKQRIADLIAAGCEPRRIIHFSCDGATAEELRRLVMSGRETLSAGVTEPRYWFLDEITDVPGWPAAIKWLRDQTLLSQDCVVLTGSSARDLAEARKQLAGRRGAATDSDIALYPMSFRDFCLAAGPSIPADTPALGPGRLMSPEARETIQELAPWASEIADAWSNHLEVGGFPHAVSDYLEGTGVSGELLRSLWDVIHGEAFRRSQLAPRQTAEMLKRLSLSLSSPLNLTRLARELGVASHHTASERIADLLSTMIAWPCHRAGDGGLPLLRAQSKLYFTDPAYIEVARWQTGATFVVDAGVEAEQQLGLAIRRAAATGSSGAPESDGSVMYERTARSEIDFVSPEMGGFGVEVKYTDRSLGRAAMPLRTRYGRGIVTTRTTLDLSSEVWQVPCGLLAILLG